MRRIPSRIRTTASTRSYSGDGRYWKLSLGARFSATYPRLPAEVIKRVADAVDMLRKSDDPQKTPLAVRECLMNSEDNICDIGDGMMLALRILGDTGHIELVSVYQIAQDSS